MDWPLTHVQTFHVCMNPPFSCSSVGVSGWPHTISDCALLSLASPRKTQDSLRGCMLVPTLEKVGLVGIHFPSVMCYILPLFISFLGLIFFFSHNYSSTPCHRPADSTCLHNCFLPSASLDIYNSFLITYMYFFVIPSHSTTFHFVLSLLQTFPSLRYINPQFATYFPKLDLLSTLIYCCTNLVFFFFSHP